MNSIRPLITALILIGTLSLIACKDQSPDEQENAAPLESQSKDALQPNRLERKTSVEPEKATPVLNSKIEPISDANNSSKLISDLGFSEDFDNQTQIPEPVKHCLNEPKINSEEKKRLLNDECLRISNRLASVSMQSCLAAKLNETGCESVLGFPIMVSDFPPVEGKTPQGRILIVGGTHADELTSVSTTFAWIGKLNKHHSGLFHWRVAPLMNPDGLLKKSATRTNHNGVDLNRNMPSNDWYDNALKYWNNKSGKNPRKYPGEEPSSEPETQWLVDEINDFKPDAIISIHAPYGIVDFDSLRLYRAPKSLGKLHLNLLGTYPGSLGNYAGINRNIPVITVELPHAWDMPSQQEVTKIWQDIVAWLKDNINNTKEK